MRTQYMVLVVAACMAASAPVPDARAGPEDLCGERLQLVARDHDGRPVCSHGADPANDAAGHAVFGPDIGPTPDPPCLEDDGSSARVQVLYGVPSDRSETAPTIERATSDIRRAVAWADAYFNGSDPDTEQHLRWECTQGQVDVQQVTLTPVGSDGTFTFSDLHASLTSKARRAGEARRAARDRVYVTFVGGLDRNSYPYCGEGTLDDDDRHDSKNRNNVGPAYSLIACWRGLTTLHEVGHNLGAVQLTAPHSTGRFHCRDERDVMCYDDGGPQVEKEGMKQPCGLPTQDLLHDTDRQFDCNRDDYYNPSPTGDYLAHHWNLANSQWVRTVEPGT